MVFCNLLSKNDEYLEYAIGGSPNDLSGRLRVNHKDLSYVLITAPEHTKVYGRHIAAMLSRAKRDYKKGIFEEKLAYQIG